MAGLFTRQVQPSDYAVESESTQATRLLQRAPAALCARDRSHSQASSDNRESCSSILTFFRRSKPKLGRPKEREMRCHCPITAKRRRPSYRWGMIVSRSPKYMATGTVETYGYEARQQIRFSSNWLCGSDSASRLWT